MIITLQSSYSIPPLRKKRTEIKLIAWRYIYTNYLILVFRSTSFGRYVVERGIVRTTKSFCKRLEWNKRRNRKRKKRTKGEDRVPSGSWSSSGEWIGKVRSCSPSLPPEIREGNKGDGFLLRIYWQWTLMNKESFLNTELPWLSFIPKNREKIDFYPKK